jgi:dCMP deaminase
MVVLLITGEICSGKELLAKLLEQNYGYKLHRLINSSLENIIDIENLTFKPITPEITNESNEVLIEALNDWSSSHVIYPVIDLEWIKKVSMKRSYIKVIGLSAPLMRRFKTFNFKYNEISLDNFVVLNDEYLFELNVTKCIDEGIIKIINKFNFADLEKEIEKHLLIKSKIFRPVWDQYFMKLAHVVKQRSNCMKRSVGAIIVDNNRINSTGYNGVPGKITNCYQGGCKRCNINKPSGVSLDECNCIHAEEASVIEVGVTKTKGATMYVTLSPCRWCTKVIIAAGIARVVYDEKYTHYEDSEQLLKKAGIILDCVNIEP